MEGGTEDGEDDEDSHRVVKMRLKHLLSDQQAVGRVQEAIERMHEIVERALVFGKLLFLADLERHKAANGGVFDASVASLLTAAFPIDAGQIEEWMDVVSSRLEGRVGRPYAPAKAELMRRMHVFYDDVAGRGLLPTTKLSCTNLSSPKGHAAAQMATNYRTNVHCHFDKYIRRLVRLRITAAVRDEHGLAQDAVVPRPLRRALGADIRAVGNDVLQSSVELSCREALRPWVEQSRATLMPPAPVNAGPHWRFLSQKQHPERWLPYMVAINQMLEGESAKLFSPLPQRTSFVPAHIRLDTVGLIDLLVAADTDDTTILKAALEALDMPAPSGASSSSTTAVKYDLPGLVPPLKKGNTTSMRASKAKLYVDLATIVSPSLVDRVRQEPTRQGAAFRTAMWRCLTKLGSDKHASLAHDGLIFNNVIDTDGVSVSLHYVSPSLYGVTRFNGGFRAIKACQRSQAASEKAKGATYVTSLSAPEREALMARRDGRLLSCDPGKRVLALVTDGGGTKVAYTYAQRRFESGAKEHSRELCRLLDVRRSPAERTAGELQQSIGAVPDQPDATRSTSKSCLLPTYEHYLRTRAAVAPQLAAFYRRHLFRARRYDAHVGRRASVDRFVSRIKKAFGAVAAILYGDWGRSPNLKHQPPSPGVGLRRSLCSHFRVFLVHEAFTSSVCPRCHGGHLTKPRHDGACAEVHHLLKCPNVRCPCRWWNRDVLGALNILDNGEHALRTGRWHPVFAATAA